MYHLLSWAVVVLGNIMASRAMAMAPDFAPENRAWVFEHFQYHHVDNGEAEEGTLIYIPSLHTELNCTGLRTLPPPSWIDPHSRRPHRPSYHDNPWEHWPYEDWASTTPVFLELKCNLVPRLHPDPDYPWVRPQPTSSLLASSLSSSSSSLPASLTSSSRSDSSSTIDSTTTASTTTSTPTMVSSTLYSSPSLSSSSSSSLLTASSGLSSSSTTEPISTTISTIPTTTTTTTNSNTISTTGSTTTSTTDSTKTSTVSTTGSTTTSVKTSVTSLAKTSTKTSATTSKSKTSQPSETQPSPSSTPNSSPSSKPSPSSSTKTHSQLPLPTDRETRHRAYHDSPIQRGVHQLGDRHKHDLGLALGLGLGLGVPGASALAWGVWSTLTLAEEGALMSTLLVPAKVLPPLPLPNPIRPPPPGGGGPCRGCGGWHDPPELPGPPNTPEPPPVRPPPPNSPNPPEGPGGPSEPGEPSEPHGQLSPEASDAKRSGRRVVETHDEVWRKLRKEGKRLDNFNRDNGRKTIPKPWEPTLEHIEEEFPETLMREMDAVQQVVEDANDPDLVTYQNMVDAARQSLLDTLDRLFPKQPGFDDDFRLWPEVDEAAKSTVQAADSAERFWDKAINLASEYSKSPDEELPPARSRKGKERMYPLPPALQPKPPVRSLAGAKRALRDWDSRPFTTLLRNATLV